MQNSVATFMRIFEGYVKNLVERHNLDPEEVQLKVRDHNGKERPWFEIQLVKGPDTEPYCLVLSEEDEVSISEKALSKCGNI